ncbi:hypothetical protein LCGC14_0959690 [marine sediment metagenome]
MTHLNFAILQGQYTIMKVILLSCDAQRPDKRAIAKCIAEVSSNIDESLARELADILLEGDSVDIEVDDKSSGSALRAFRKLDIEYEIEE